MKQAAGRRWTVQSFTFKVQETSLDLQSLTINTPFSGILDICDMGGFFGIDIHQSGDSQLFVLRFYDSIWDRECTFNCRWKIVSTPPSLSWEMRKAWSFFWLTESKWPRRNDDLSILQEFAKRPGAAPLPDRKRNTDDPLGSPVSILVHPGGRTAWVHKMSWFSGDNLCVWKDIKMDMKENNSLWCLKISSW